MKNLMTMSRDIESTWLPSLGYPLNIEHCSNGVKNRHSNLIHKRDKYLRVCPMEVDRVCCWNDTGEPHGEKNSGPEGAVARSGQCWREEGGDGKKAEGGNGGEVEEAGERVAVKGVEDRGEEG
ncbi:hypothetical protein HanRHA438_Chr06g0272021 [Helianthus annuus]|nr:hypothetical protein HanRHA438_Chr06g0272021 [Helianthus annuus]